MSATVLGFVAGALTVAGCAAAIPPRALRKASSWRSANGGSVTATRLGARALRGLSAIGRRFGPRIGANIPGSLRGRIAAAGLSSIANGPLAGLGTRELMAAKLAATALGGAAGTIIGTMAPGRLGIAVIIGGPIAGFLAPDLWLVRRARERTRRVRRELPGMLDLLRVTVEAGLSLAAALTAVGKRTRGELGVEWRLLGRQVALGVPVGDALAALATRVPLPEVTALIAALERSRRHGAPLADTLAAQAHDARAARRRRIREEAAQAGPKIQLVVALLLVPSVLLLVAAALAVALIDGRGAVAIG